MNELTSDEAANFRQRASAVLAHQELLELIANGGMQARSEVIEGPLRQLGEVLRTFRTKYPELQWIEFRGRLFVLPDPSTHDINVQVLRLDRGTTVNGS